MRTASNILFFLYVLGLSSSGFSICVVQEGSLQSVNPVENNSVESEYFHKGTLLKADGKVITTKWFGHAAPALIDLDKDGDFDLLVGQYTDGDVDVYMNVGSNEAPKYSAEGKLKAGGEIAAVKTFCCVGFTPCVVDFDGDGHLDILSGSYPGELHIFRGNNRGTFDARADLKDSNNETLKPGLATTAHAVDLDGDGDFDLLSSLKKGGVAACYNVGSLVDPVFKKWEEVRVDGEPIPFTHTGPVVFDFDGDGIKDLIVASEKVVKNDTWRAQLIFYRNKAVEGRPVYEQPEVILDGHVGLRLKVFPIDHDRDGHLDLLVGDMFADCPQADYTGFVWLYRGKSRTESKITSKNEPARIPLSTTGNGRANNAKVAFETSITNHAGQSFVVVNISIEDHWHIYGNGADEASCTKIALAPVPGITFSKPEYPEAEEVVVYGKAESQYFGSVEIKIPFQADMEKIDPSQSKVELKISYQVCGDSTVGGVCLPRRTTSVTVDLTNE